MPNTDFFDDDLVKKHEATKRIKLGPGDAPAATAAPVADALPSRPVSDLNLTRMAKHKEEVSAQVAQAMEELERLRTRQEDLEREKQDLEDLRRKQHEYESGKRELMTHLNQSLVKLEKDELKAEKLTELLGATRLRFRSFLSEVEDLQEDQWPEDGIRSELDKALTRIEQVRIEYNKALSKIDALAPDSGSSGSVRSPMIMEHRGVVADENRSFGYWLKVGVAVTLPLSLVLIALAVLRYLVDVGLL